MKQENLKRNERIEPWDQHQSRHSTHLPATDSLELKLA